MRICCLYLFTVFINLPRTLELGKIQQLKDLNHPRSGHAFSSEFLGVFHGLTLNSDSIITAFMISGGM